MSGIGELKDWQPRGESRIEVIDMHTGGEPLRVIVDGLPDIQGSNVLEKRRWFSQNHDSIRTMLMWEPRGHADMYGAVLTQSLDADFDVFFLHNEGYSTMCGHAIIALARLAVEAELVPAGRTSISFNVPAGRIEARVEIADGRVVRSSFRNVPSYVALRDGRVEVPGVGKVRFDIAYGGAYYAIVDAQDLGIRLCSDDAQRLIKLGRAIKEAVVSSHSVEHPTEPDLSFLYGTIFVAAAEQADHHSRNVCIFADGELDRSPTGSGVSARAALHHARGELAIDEPITIESILGSTMTVRVAEVSKMGSQPVIIPEVSGQAFFSGRSSFCVEQKDMLKDGFLVR